MSLLKQIITSELNKRLEREATSEDIIGAIEYIDEWLDGTFEPTLSDIEDALKGYRHDKYSQCEICGKYYRPDDLEEHFYKKVCPDMFCKKQAQEDYEFDPRKEWGTY